MTGQNTIPYAYADKIRDLPSFPLPGNSGYRGLWPISAAAVGRHIGRIDLVHAHSFFLCGLLARRVARKQRLPFVLTYHTLLEAYSHYAGFASSLVRLWLRAHTRAFANSADVVTVPTAATAMMLRAVGVTIPIAVIPSGIDVAAIDAARYDAAYAEQLRSHCDDKIVLCVARLGREKNLPLLIQACARLRTPVTLVIAGGGPERPALERMAQACGNTARVRFLGALQREDLAKLYKVSDVFAFPSLTETQGLVLAEALYAELPLVVCDTPQAREMLLETDTRFVPAQVAAFSTALDAALEDASDPDLGARRKAVGARYDRRVTSQQMAELYRNLLKNAMSPG